MNAPTMPAPRACPDFVIAGSAKAGTTALAMMLDQHPDVYMSDSKEPDYFVNGFGVDRGLVNHNGVPALAGMDSDHFIDSDEKYRALFGGARDDQLLGEASPRYLIEPEVAVRLRAHNPAVNIVLILRDPAAVAFANFVHHVRDRLESIPHEDRAAFLDAARYEGSELHPFANHLALPAYAVHLPAWVEAFGSRGKLHIIVYEEFLSDRRAALTGLFAFLGLRDDVSIDVERRVNISGLPRSEWLHSALLGSVGIKKCLRPFIPTKLRRDVRLRVEAANAGTVPTLDPRTRARLDARYEPDARYVETLLGRPVERWRRSARSPA